MAGADFGMKTFLTLSDGTTIVSPEFYKQGLKAVRSANKALSRKQYLSNGWFSAKRHLARVHRKIANQRRDWFFKLALRLVRKYDTIAIETLNLEGMKRLWGRKISDKSPWVRKILNTSLYRATRENAPFAHVKFKSGS